MRLACDFPRWTGGTPTAALWRLSVAADAFPHEDLDRIHKMIRIFKKVELVKVAPTVWQKSSAAFC